nr:hypothetical protein [Mesorhizobium sp.]
MTLPLARTTKLTVALFRALVCAAFETRRFARASLFATSPLYRDLAASPVAVLALPLLAIDALTSLPSAVPRASAVLLAEPDPCDALGLAVGMGG